MLPSVVGRKRLGDLKQGLDPDVLIFNRMDATECGAEIIQGILSDQK